MPEGEDRFDERLQGSAGRQRELERRLTELDATVLRPSRRLKSFVFGLVAAGAVVGTLLIPLLGQDALLIAVLSFGVGPLLLLLVHAGQPLTVLEAERLLGALSRGGGVLGLRNRSDLQRSGVRLLAGHLGFELRGGFLLDPARAASGLAETRAQVVCLLREASSKRWRLVRQFPHQDFVGLALQELEEEGVVVERDGRLRLTPRPATYRG